MTKLTKAERETIIIYNEQDDVANVITCNVRLQNKLKTLSQKHTSVVHKDGNGIFEEYELPKSFVRIVAPRQMSDEEKEKMKVRGRLLFESRKNK